jgi:pimeloyl-ACP methyl ester carboxylesterase
MPIPSLNFGGTGKELLFLHANGYPPDCYKPLLSRLAENFHITAMVQRPLWSDSNPEDIDDWHILTEDLLHYMTAHYSTPIACVGHSMGGIALLRAALREPERFKAIVLLDPVLFPPYFIRMWQIVFGMGLGEQIHPLIKNAKNRRRRFDDLDKLFSGYRRKPVFRYMDDESLRAYVQGIACAMDGGDYRLCYSADWEVRIYVTGVRRDMDIWRGLPKLEVPTLIIRGAETDTFWERTGKLVKRKQPKVRVEMLEKSTHLLALERPIGIAKIIQSFFEENL